MIPTRLAGRKGASRENFAPSFVCSNELLIGEHPLPAGFKEEPITHVQVYTVGYDREMRLLPGVMTVDPSKAAGCSPGICAPRKRHIRWSDA